MRRTALVFKKIGMTRRFDANGHHVPVTVLQLEDTFVTNVFKDESKDYFAIQIATSPIKVKNVSKAMKGFFAKSSVEPKRNVRQFRVSRECADVQVGAQLSVNHFVPGQSVDAVGTTIGKGFAGVMKRWNYAGQRASHGNSLSHRVAGSTGQRQDPGRVEKGHTMPGHLGCERVTIQNLVVVEVLADKNIVLVRGAVPGHKGAYVILRDAKKKKLHKDIQFPTVLYSTNDKQDSVAVDQPMVSESIAAPETEMTAQTQTEA